MREKSIMDLPNKLSGSNQPSLGWAHAKALVPLGRQGWCLVTTRVFPKEKKGDQESWNSNKKERRNGVNFIFPQKLRRREGEG